MVAARYRWPGPVHEGGGVAQGIIDERASEAQRAALFKILGGQEQEPTTVFNIYGSTVAKELEPVFAPIEFACDIAARTGRLVGPGRDGARRSSRSGTRSPARRIARIIRLPEGFEFREAEVAQRHASAARATISASPTGTATPP